MSVAFTFSISELGFFRCEVSIRGWNSGFIRFRTYVWNSYVWRIYICGYEIGVGVVRVGRVSVICVGFVCLRCIYRTYVCV